MLSAVSGRKEATSAAQRFWRIEQTLERLGSGYHSLEQIRHRSGLTRTTVHRFLQAAVAEGAVIYKRGYYGLARDVTQPVEGTGRNPLVQHDSALIKAATQLQHETAQVALAYARVRMDTPEARMCLHADSGLRTDYQEALIGSDSDIKRAMRYASLTEDPAGLVILAHSDRAPETKLMRRIQYEGYAVGPSLLEDWHMLAAPVRRQMEVTGAVAVLARPSQMQCHQQWYAMAALEAAAKLSDRYEQGGVARLRLAS